jgi:hypothetical protein
MLLKPRLFSRELIRKVNQDMIDGKPVDTSKLPAAVVTAIRSHRYSREALAEAWTKAFADKGLLPQATAGG